MGVRDAKCPACGAPMRSMKPANVNAVPALRPDTPSERGGVVESNKPRLPKPSASTKSKPHVSN